MYAIYDVDADRYISGITSRGRGLLHKVGTNPDESSALRFRDEDRAQDMLERLIDEGALRGDFCRVVEVDC